jgi:hypothetical protein
MVKVDIEILTDLNALSAYEYKRFWNSVFLSV